MTAKCEKRGCEKEAVDTLRFTSTVHKDLDMESPVVLCGEHSKEAQRFPETDATGLRKWLES